MPPTRGGRTDAQTSAEAATQAGGSRTMKKTAPGSARRQVVALCVSLLLSAFCRYWVALWDLRLGLPSSAWCSLRLAGFGMLSLACWSGQLGLLLDTIDDTTRAFGPMLSRFEGFPRVVWPSWCARPPR
ncbi:hypothetical protein NDU88_004143 [Pleurodeles waltl]|uniref:Uncharacterized protein n=1 Tax=Pleurodeles waltl TaxID=8319 RepID=A0AAV7V4D9_PLEWA|nr:hypothetical protein NDU88_004143 [Pleurodeles waltl]